MATAMQKSMQFCQFNYNEPQPPSPQPPHALTPALTNKCPSDDCKISPIQRSFDAEHLWVMKQGPQTQMSHLYFSYSHPDKMSLYINFEFWWSVFSKVQCILSQWRLDEPKLFKCRNSPISFNKFFHLQSFENLRQGISDGIRYVLHIDKYIMH